MTENKGAFNGSQALKRRCKLKGAAESITAGIPGVPGWLMYLVRQLAAWLPAAWADECVNRMAVGAVYDESFRMRLRARRARRLLDTAVPTDVQRMIVEAVDLVSREVDAADPRWASLGERARARVVPTADQERPAQNLALGVVLRLSGAGGPVYAELADGIMAQDAVLAFEIGGTAKSAGYVSEGRALIEEMRALPRPGIGRCAGNLTAVDDGHWVCCPNKVVPGRDRCRACVVTRR